MHRLHKQDKTAASHQDVHKLAEGGPLKSAIARSAEKDGRNEAGQGNQKTVSDRVCP